jgi:hypothetical protein
MAASRIGVIYLITNEISGRQYVGATIRTLEQRWAGHVSSAKCGRGYNDMHADITALGPEAFSIKAIDSAPRCDLLEMEHQWVRRLGTQEPGGYNKTAGGAGLRGLRHRPETRAKIGRAHIGMTRPRASIEAGAAKRRGRPISPAASAAISRPIIAAGVRYQSIQLAAAALGVAMETISRRAAAGLEGYVSLAPRRQRRKRTEEQVERMRRSQGKRVVADGIEYCSIAAAGAALGLTRPAVAYRIAAGYPGYARL